MATANGIRISFHGEMYDTPVAAINVKHYSWPHDIDDVIAETARIERTTPEVESQYVYDTAQRAFWEAAEQTADGFGYDGIEAQGRMGGWLVPLQEGSGITEEEMRESKHQRERFAEFEREIGKHLREVDDVIRQVALASREEAEHYNGC